jgi:hypothetical protein
MEALRQIVRPHNRKITITLPEILGDNEEVEVIVLPKGEKKQKKGSLDVKKFRGIWADRDIDVEKDCKEMRQEWERDF